MCIYVCVCVLPGRGIVSCCLPARVALPLSIECSLFCPFYYPLSMSSVCRVCVWVRVCACWSVIVLCCYLSPALPLPRSVAFRVHCTLERTFREFIEYFLPRWTIRIVFAKCQKGVWHKLSNKMREREGERERQRGKKKLSTCVHYDQLSCKSRKG